MHGNMHDIFVPNVIVIGLRLGFHLTMLLYWIWNVIISDELPGYHLSRTMVTAATIRDMTPGEQSDLAELQLWLSHRAITLLKP